MAGADPFDGKAVVIVPGAASGDAQSGPDGQGPRRLEGAFIASGTRSNRKRMATVAGIYPTSTVMVSVRKRWRRSVSLRPVPRHRPAAPKPVGKKLWARVRGAPMKTARTTGFAEGQRRDPMHQADWVVLVDGDLA